MSTDKLREEVKWIEQQMMPSSIEGYTRRLIAIAREALDERDYQKLETESARAALERAKAVAERKAEDADRLAKALEAAKDTLIWASGAFQTIPEMEAWLRQGAPILAKITAALDAHREDKVREVV